jgi:membrane protein YdbS with pleckstrin-like domain
MDAVFDVPGAPWVAVSPALATVRRAVLGLTVAPVVAVVLAAAVVSPELLVVWVPVLVAVLVAGAVAFWGLARNAASWAYAERDEDLFVRHGILVRRLEVVPYGRMQLVEVSSGPLHTAAPGTDARILGVPADEASRLRDRLTALGEAQAAGL